MEGAERRKRSLRLVADGMTEGKGWSLDTYLFVIERSELGMEDVMTLTAALRRTMA